MVSEESWRQWLNAEHRMGVGQKNIPKHTLPVKGGGRKKKKKKRGPLGVFFLTHGQIDGER